MSFDLWEQLEFVARLLAAGLCGALIGYERNNRLKEAGVRTHLIVSVASCLMMIISKYGFFDVLGENVGVDPSRVAAGIVTGVGFLGAGIIFVRRTGQSVTGLTTSAGIWATVGVGMSVGAGMYFVGIIAALIIILAQIVLHKNFRFLRLPVGEQMVILTKNSEKAIQQIRCKLQENQIEVVNIKAERKNQDCIEIDIFAKFPKQYRPADVITLFAGDPDILSVEI